MKIEKLKDLIQSCHMNFMIGSGISRPYLSTLNNIEKLLTELSNKKDLDETVYNIIKASIYNVYFSEVMWPNNIVSDDENRFNFEVGDSQTKGTEESYKLTLSNYRSFLSLLNEMVQLRYSSILNIQINLFSTNIDVFVERAIEDTKHEFNDGFKGRLNPTYDLSNFQKSYSKTSLQYENKSEIPVFNILKVHGSLNWENDKDSTNVIHSDFKHLIKVKDEFDKLNNREFLIDIDNDSTIENLISTADLYTLIDDYSKFDIIPLIDAYEKILVVNPTKEKFERSVIDEKFYELLRLYANSLERENSILFVLGFSFADEHIRDITLRAANSNPTLQIIIFAFNGNAKDDIRKELRLDENSSRNNNIIVISPHDFLNSNYIDKDERDRKSNDLESFDFQTIIREVFEPIADLIRVKKLCNECR